MEVYQVGRQTKSGIPVARESYAFDDIVIHDTTGGIESVWKYGVSADTYDAARPYSARADRQTNALNRGPEGKTYRYEIVQDGLPDRVSAFNLEYALVEQYFWAHDMRNPPGNKRPIIKTVP